MLDYCGCSACFWIFRLFFAVYFLSKISSDLERIDADIVLMGSFFVVMHCGLFVKCHSVFRNMTAVQVSRSHSHRHYKFKASQGEDKRDPLPISRKLAQSIHSPTTSVHKRVIQYFHRNELRLVCSMVRFVSRRTKPIKSPDRTMIERRISDRSNQSREAIVVRMVRLV